MYSYRNFPLITIAVEINFGRHINGQYMCSLVESKAVLLQRGLHLQWVFKHRFNRIFEVRLVLQFQEVGKATLSSYESYNLIA